MQTLAFVDFAPATIHQSIGRFFHILSAPDLRELIFEELELELEHPLNLNGVTRACPAMKHFAIDEESKITVQLLPKMVYLVGLDFSGASVTEEDPIGFQNAICKLARIVVANAVRR